jgi:hypothetical protein
MGKLGTPEEEETKTTPVKEVDVFDSISKRALPTEEEEDQSKAHSPNKAL